MRLWSFLLRYARFQVIGSTLAGIATGVTNIWLVSLLNRLIHTEQQSPNSTEWYEFAFMCMCRLFFGVCSGALLTRLTHQALSELRIRLCRQISLMPLISLEMVGSHRLLVALTEDIKELTGAIVNLPYFLINIGTIIASIPYLFKIDSRSALGVMMLLGIGGLTYQIPVLWAKKELRLGREAQDLLFEHFRGLLAGAKELKLNARKRAQFLDVSLFNTTSRVCRHGERGTTAYTVTANWNRLLFFVYSGLIVAWSSPVLRRSTVGVPGFLLALLYLMGPLEALMNAGPSFARAGATVGKLSSLGFELSRSEEQLPPVEEVKPSTFELLELRSVEFEYMSAGSPFVVGPINLKIAKGDVLFIVGGNGSGKTTLAKVLTGLYAPSRGQILLDGRGAMGLSLERYRQLFSAVFSDFYLFGALLPVEAGRAESRARELLHQLQLQNKVTIDAGVLSTVELSSGQRKRLALLVSILEDRPIYVFDEWAADQDPEFREMFYRTIIPSLKRQGKTVVLISHDERYFDCAERIIRLECGQLANEEYAGGVLAGASVVQE